MDGYGKGMEQNQSIDIMSWIKALTRRVWTILIVFIVGSVLAAAVAYVLPPVYESTARILVESQQIPEDLAQSTVSQGAAERIELIEQRMMTRQNLLAVIDRTGLFADRRDLAPTEKVDIVRDATTFESLSFAPDRRGPVLVTAFTITYRASSPGVAARVANEFVTMALEQNISSRSARASETYEFFQNEVDRLAGELLDLETQLARYKNENGDALPDSFNFRMNELSMLEQRQFERERRRIQLGEQRRLVEQFMRDGVGVPGAASSPEQRQLADLRRMLVQKRSILAESHPEIVALKANISAIEASLGAETARAEAETDAEARPASLATSQAEAQLGLIDREMALLADQDTADETRAEALRESLARTPQVEMALNAYQRRYANLQARYDTAIQKLASAETGQRLEVNRQAERFEVIEQAQVPATPVAPNRLLIAGGGAAGSLGLALALALALELINPAIRTSADLQRRLQLHPVVAVPYIHTRGERRRRALKWAVRIMLVVGGLAALLWAIEEYVMPLQVLWQRLLDRTGLEGFIRAAQDRFS
jgi:polysaccharide chain length determinant protein (PEP-CTERM system associated)